MEQLQELSITVEELQKSILRLRSKAMKRHGLGVSDMSCLMMLKQSPAGLTSTELSRQCHVDKALISRTVKKLTERGIIAYVTPRITAATAAEEDGEHPVQRRGAYRIRLRLTELGEKMVQELYDVAGAASAYASQDISDTEMYSFMCTLQKVNVRFKEYVEAHIGGNQEPDELI